MTVSNKEFNGKPIRTGYSKEDIELRFSVVDVCGILSESVQPRKYWSDLKTRLKAESNELSEKIGQLKMAQRTVRCVRPMC
jgi:RNA recognition motif-containing protein